MAINYTQTANAAGAGNSAACSGATNIGTQAKNCLATVGGTGAGSPVTVGGSQFDIGTNLSAVYMEMVPAAGVVWNAGTWTVRLNVTTANSNITWTGTYICRLNSSNVSQGTIGSLTGQTTSLSTTGVKTHSVTNGTSQSPAAGDKAYVVLVFTVANANNQSFACQFNQNIDTPLQDQTTATFSDQWQNLADAAPTVSKIGILTFAPAADDWSNEQDTWNFDLQQLQGATPIEKTFSDDASATWGDSVYGGRQRIGWLDAWSDQLIGVLEFTATDPWANFAGNAVSKLLMGLYTSSFSDPWETLADSAPAVLEMGFLTASFSDAMPAMGDSLAQQSGQTFQPLTFAATDDWANLQDSFGWLQPWIFASTDSLNNWLDAVAKELRRSGWGDHLDASFIAIGADRSFTATDSLNNWLDAVAKELRARIRWSDQLTVDERESNEVGFGSVDNANNWQDGINAQLDYAAGYVVYLSDGAGNIFTDENGNYIALSGFIDSLYHWDDRFTPRVIQFLPVDDANYWFDDLKATLDSLASFAADDADSWADSWQPAQPPPPPENTPQFFETWQTLADQTVILYQGLLFRPAADNLNNFQDNLKSALTAKFTDDASANWRDDLTIFKPIVINWTDNLNNFLDTPTFFEPLQPVFTDNANLWADNLLYPIELARFTEPWNTFSDQLGAHVVDRDTRGFVPVRPVLDLDKGVPIEVITQSDNGLVPIIWVADLGAVPVIVIADTRNNLVPTEE